MLNHTPQLQKSSKGFNLIEMAIVLLIISALLGGLLVSIGSTREINNRNAAETTMEDISEALYGFAQATGRLPCPATPTSAGVEDPVGGGNCARDYGFVPAATLGLSGPVNGDSLLMDDWLNPYRYSVSSALGNSYTTANFGGLTIAQLANSADLRVCSAPDCATVLANNLPAVIISLGANWASFTSAEEVENSGERTVSGYRLPDDTDFVSTGYNETLFDDLLNWVSPNILVSRLIAAGQRP